MSRLNYLERKVEYFEKVMANTKIYEEIKKVSTKEIEIKEKREDVTPELKKKKFVKDKSLKAENTINLEEYFNEIQKAMEEVAFGDEVTQSPDLRQRQQHSSDLRFPILYGSVGRHHGPDHRQCRAHAVDRHRLVPGDVETAQKKTCFFLAFARGQKGMQAAHLVPGQFQRAEAPVGRRFRLLIVER